MSPLSLADWSFGHLSQPWNPASLPGLIRGKQMLFTDIANHLFARRLFTARLTG